MALMAAMMEAAKFVMSPLPNIEPVTLIVTVCTLVCGLRALYAVYVFVLLDGLLYGFGMWFIAYLYVWAVLVVAVWLLRKNEGRIFWALVAGIYGFAFGALCAIPYFIAGGAAAGISYWLAGIPFDLLHAAGNFVMALTLQPVCTRVFRRLYVQNG